MAAKSGAESRGPASDPNQMNGIARVNMATGETQYWHLNRVPTTSCRRRHCRRSASSGETLTESFALSTRTTERFSGNRRSGDRFP